MHGAQYGRLHGAVRLRWGYLDEMLPAPWVHRDEPTLHVLMREAHARAAKAATGWKPARPSQRIIADAQSFADAARRIGHADAEDVTEHLRLAMRAFLAGDHSTARAVFEALLPPIWLAAGDARGESLRNRAARALACCRKAPARQIGLLRVLLDDIPGAAALLARAPGLGWSNPDHPGHTLFPLFSMLLSRGTIGDALMAELDATGGDPQDTMIEEDEGHRPRLATPSMVAVIPRARSGLVLTDANGDAAIDAMRVAAEKRVEGILGNSRRRHYGHAALLVASCLAFVPKRREAESSKWVADLQQQYSRRTAFRAELAQACASLGLT